MIKTFKYFLISTIALLSISSFAKDAAKNKAKPQSAVAKGKAKSAVCMACHGTAGISNNPMWPNLAGQKEQYLIQQLKAFKSGDRKNPPMAPFIKALTDEDIKNLAAYYSSLKCGK